MAIVVEHEKRKKEILQKAQDVFEAEGYNDATFQKIADRCGITRTTLYIYFNNKQEIFLWSIKQLLSTLELSINEITAKEELSAEETLRITMHKIVDSCKENKQLFNVLLPYLLQLKKTGKEPAERIRRRVIKLKHFMSTQVIKGIHSKEFKDTNVKDINEMLYAMIESAIFRLTIMDENCDNIKSAINLAIDGLLISK